ncbi:MAG: CYTH domain-containing protein [Myxococcales bacterium]|nr:CYTH domain-containing protein [Myxococcales bacterium]
MATEIERKFLVASDAWRAAADGGTPYLQGYLASGGGATVRVRMAGKQGKLTIKGKTQGIARAEFEYTIPAADAEVMLRTLCRGQLVEKTRYRVPVGAHVWEVDVFVGANLGLVLAEVELGAEDEAFERPPWAGREVSDDPRYFNAYLARTPYAEWEPAP